MIHNIFSRTRLQVFVVLSCIFFVQSSYGDSTTSDLFTITRLTKVAERHAWIAEFYPTYRQEFRQEMVNHQDFSAIMKALRQAHPRGTVELSLKHYLESNFMKDLIIAGVGLTTSFLTGGFAGTFTSFSFDEASQFQLTVGKNQIKITVPREKAKLLELPESQKNNPVIRDSIYQRLKKYFAEDAIYALSRMEEKLTNNE